MNPKDFVEVSTRQSHPETLLVHCIFWDSSAHCLAIPFMPLSIDEDTTDGIFLLDWLLANRALCFEPGKCFGSKFSGNRALGLGPF